MPEPAWLAAWLAGWLAPANQAAIQRCASSQPASQPATSQPPASGSQFTMRHAPSAWTLVTAVRHYEGSYVGSHDLDRGGWRAAMMSTTQVTYSSGVQPLLHVRWPILGC